MSKCKRACVLLWILAVCLSTPLFAQARAKSTKPKQSERLSPTPQAVFRRVSPSVFVVEALGPDGQPVALGSGVAISPTEIVTNRHVIEDGVAWRIRKDHRTWPAIITHLDGDHDLCQLKAEGLQAKAADIRKSSTLGVGERVYAIGAPEGLELTFSEGLVSGIREYHQGRVIQTSASISHGSSGGGLFDNSGKLIGITTFTLIEGQNLNFALPTEWISELTVGPSFGAESALSTDSASYHELLLLELAKEASDQGDYTRAVQACMQATKLAPNEPVAWNNLGVAYSKLHDYDHALTAALKAADLAPNNPFIWNNLGSAYEDLGDYIRAIGAHERSVHLKPEDPQGWNDLGTAYHLAQRNPKAIDSYREALRLDPTIAIIWGNLGTSYEELGNYEKARSALEQAIRLDSRLVDAWYVLGEVYSALRDRDKVLKVYEQLKVLAPQRAEQFFRELIVP
jgi:Flp pilus assembly protein TadD